jgi:hypothetical protein
LAGFTSEHDLGSAANPLWAFVANGLNEKNQILAEV